MPTRFKLWIAWQINKPKPEQEKAMSKNQYTTETSLVGVRNINVLMKQKSITLDSGLKIDSYFVQEPGGNPYVVQVVGDDADLVVGAAYSVMLRERKQTRVSDGATFVELQVAAAQPG